MLANPQLLQDPTACKHVLGPLHSVLLFVMLRTFHTVGVQVCKDRTSMIVSRSPVSATEKLQSDKGYR